MNLSEYQRQAVNTAVYPNRGDNIVYPTLGLIGESGELVEKIKKMIRDDNGVMTPQRRDAIRGEIGDILWYVASVCTEANLDMGCLYLFFDSSAATKRKANLSLLALQLPEEISNISNIVLKIQYEPELDVNYITDNLGIHISSLLKLISDICFTSALDINMVAKSNIEKLRDRQLRDALGGDGDNR